jgi:hypothetical protein
MMPLGEAAGAGWGRGAGDFGAVATRGALAAVVGV